MVHQELFSASCLARCHHHAKVDQKGSQLTCGITEQKKGSTLTGSGESLREARGLRAGPSGQTGRGRGGQGKGA